MAKSNIPYIDSTKQEILEEVYVYDGRKTFRGQTWVKNVNFLIGTTCIKESAFEECTGLESVDIPEGVTLIDYSAFKGCTNLKEVSLPESLTTIKSGAFEFCQNLTHFYLPKNLKEIGFSDSDIPEMFMYSSELTAFSVHPENTKYATFKGMLIANDTLLVCPKNSETTTIDALPETVKKIDRNAFIGCKNLESINLSDNFKDFSYYKFSFKGCCNLRNLTLPKSMVCSYLALTDCAKLEKIEVPASVAKIDITGCTSLKEIEVDAENKHLKVVNGLIICDNCVIDTMMNVKEAVIPEGVSGIGIAAFADKPNLISVSIPASVEEVKYNAFCNSLNLKEIKVAENSEHFVVKDGMLMSKDETVLHYCLVRGGDIKVPATIEEVKGGTFSACENAKIVMPQKFDDYGSHDIFNGARNCTIGICDTASSICNTVFAHAKHLTVEITHAARSKSLKRDYRFHNVKSVKLQAPLTNIHNEAFFNCREMTELELPDTLKEIGRLAFQNCSSLETLVIPDAVTTVGEKAFVGVKQVELSNVCKVEKAYFDLDTPILFEGTKGRLFYPESTGTVIIRVTDTDESRQRFEQHKHWFGEVKLALQKIGCNFFYWDMEDNTFAARMGNFDFVFNGLELTPTEKAVSLISAVNSLHSEFKMKLTASLGKAKEKGKAKSAPKKTLFVKAGDTEAQQTAAAKKEKMEFMIEQVILTQMSEYQSQNETVKFQICSSNKTSVELGVNYKDRFCFTTSITAEKVEDGTAAEALANILKKIDEHEIDFKVV